MKKVLLASPVCQKPQILNEFLQSLIELNMVDIQPFFLFVDDNHNIQSSQILHDFTAENKHSMIYRSNSASEPFMCDEITHYWQDHHIWKVAGYKNMMIKSALENDFDYLFLIDSDLVLHPQTLQQLLSANKDIISEVFWTKWKPYLPEMPQVWLRDEYELTKIQAKFLTENEKKIQEHRFISQLHQPGIYEVGGLGACTLISRDALLKGASFAEISNLSYWGEDRHFCIRAAALGIPLFVDTHFPAYHIYREEDLQGVASFKKADMKLMNEKKDDSIFTSRFFKENDNNSEHFVFKLPDNWWSRYYEYEYASQFINDHDVCLDAACGIEHPLKFYMSENCKETYACDIDDRVLNHDLMRQEMQTVYGEDPGLEAIHFDKIHFQHANLIHLPYEQRKFDKIFCISVLEHLPKGDIARALKEFNTTLKDDGLIILTFDFPTIELDYLMTCIEEAGLAFAGEVDTNLYDDSLHTATWGGLCCFRAVLRKEKSIARFQYKDWWEANYAEGGTSGLGSYGELAEFKADVVNTFIEEHKIQSVIEFGCGDGNQLQYMNYPVYQGFDISESAVNMCKDKFKDDETKSFIHYNPEFFDAKSVSADLVVCLDVLYHIIDEEDFQRTLTHIFNCSNSYVILYTRITNEIEEEIAPTIKDRDILKRLEAFEEFTVIGVIKQKYPSLSSADFILLEKKCME
ncbi:methyltransferase domain-containing protein [Cytobacillus gottheilii]|uniref:methyltransferase domain-containing protein n=1 Tax=Cytobacillus gottheilii TaxID=859144 RepID=UPI00249444F1|nr:methyltransferase domain-containing protein [Cytobacillus gottheilii]